MPDERKQKLIERQIFIDTETTGLSPRSGHRIIELAAVEAVNGQLTGHKLHTYLDPERSIDHGARRVHGISAASLVGKPKFSDVADSFLALVDGAECIMHNAPFDTRFIDAELERAGKERTFSDVSKITCTLKLARRRFPGESASLDALMDRAGIAVRRQKHSALEDATLLAEVYFNVLSSEPNIESAIRVASIPAIENLGGRRPFGITPQALGMEKTIELVAARKETFHYRDKHKRIIDYRVINERRWTGIKGPLLYAVTDHSGQIRYIGKWESATPLYSRWLRHKTIHHQERARNLYIAELDEGRGPLTVWSSSIAELKIRLPRAMHDMPDPSVAVGLEALWLHRWKEHLLWNARPEPLLAGFHDGEYWSLA